MLDDVATVSSPNMAADPTLLPVSLLKGSQFVLMVCYVWSLSRHAG